MAKVLVRGAAAKTERSQPIRSATDSLSLPVLALGIALSTVALVDLAFVWLPLRLASPEWEFATIARTFDALALGTVGLVLGLIAALRSGSRWGQLLLGGVFVVAFVVQLSAVLVYVLNVPVALNTVPDEARGPLLRAILRTACLMSVYVPLYGWLSWFTWRRFGAKRKEAVF